MSFQSTTEDVKSFCCPDVIDDVTGAPCSKGVASWLAIAEYRGQTEVYGLTFLQSTMSMSHLQHGRWEPVEPNNCLVRVFFFKCIATESTHKMLNATCICPSKYYQTNSTFGNKESGCFSLDQLLFNYSQPQKETENKKCSLTIHSHHYLHIIHHHQKNR